MDWPRKSNKISIWEFSKMKVMNFLPVLFTESYQVSQMQTKCVVSKKEFDSVPVPYRQ